MAAKELYLTAMRILLTNDDGISAPGLAALYRAAVELGDVFVIAPSKVRSACGHAVTFHRPLEAWPESVKDWEDQEVAQGMALYGMPADCVKVGLAKLIAEPVDLVLSGINAGCNVGIHTLYSGTVAAAREGAIKGVPSISMSLYLQRREAIRWDRAQRVARDVLERLLAEPLPQDCFLNVNIPVLDDRSEPKGLCVVPSNLSAMVDDYTGDPDDTGYLKMTAGQHVSFGKVLPDTDTRKLFDGFVTVTPMKFDPTEYQRLSFWKERLKTEPEDDSGHS